MCEKCISRRSGAAGVLLLACAALAAGPAMAREWSGMATLGFGVIDRDDDDTQSSLGLAGRNRMVFDDRYVLQLQNGAEGFKSGDDTPVASFLQLDARVKLDSGIEVGPYLGLGALDDDAGTTTTLKLLGGSAQVDMGQSVVSGFAGLTEGASEDLTDYGFAGSFRPDDMTILAGSVLVETGDSGTNALWGLGAARELRDGVTLHGGVSFLTAETMQDATVMSVGMSYALSAQPGSPVLNGELLYETGDGADKRGLKMGITFPVGAAANGPSTAANSHFQSIMDPRKTLEMNMVGLTGF